MKYLNNKLKKQNSKDKKQHFIIRKTFQRIKKKNKIKSKKKILRKRSYEEETVSKKHLIQFVT